MKREYLLLGIAAVIIILAVAAYFLWPKPNFQVSNLNLSDTTVHPGDVITLNVTVTNSGSASVTYKVGIG
ncbi:MAG: hypothetical protein JTT14_01335, partial [Candidatus Brockarchaeota archaeon]|nr:hypothetical protein [Candidatus Brockarchaeota archaeon]